VVIPTKVKKGSYDEVSHVFWGVDAGCVGFHWAQPANDACVNALTIRTGMPVIGTNTRATGSAITSCARDDWNDVWYVWRPAADGTGVVSTCSYADFDTTLAVFDGCGGTQLVCNDDTCNSRQSSVTFPVVSGQSYRSRVAGSHGDFGTFELFAEMAVLTTVPDVVGVQVASALGALQAAGLLYTVTEVCDDSAPAGEVISQSPAGGSSVPQGTTVALTVSTGPCNAIVPDVVGLTLEAAQAALSVYNFTVNVTEVCSDTVPAGSVISQNPVGGTPVTEGATVDLVVSTGPCPVTVPVPDVVGQAQSAAEADITAAGLVVGTVTTQCSDSVPAGQVISQSPAGGTAVAPGSAVNLVVSAGPAVVPNVVGQAQSAAAAAIQGAGLTVGAVQQVYSTAVAAGVVIRQNPAAGVTLSCGAAVNLLVSLGTPDKVPTNREIMKKIHDKFKDLDTNGDGKLSLEEVLAALPNLPVDIFDLIDKDGDGYLTLDELKEYLKISGCFGCIKRLFVKDLLISAGGDLLLAGLGLALLSAVTVRRRG